MNRQVSLLSRNKSLLESISKMLNYLKIYHTVSNDFIHIATKNGIKNFCIQINFLPIKIAKGRYWRGATKDKLLELLVSTFDKNFPKNLGSKENGMKILRQTYLQLS